MAGPMAFGLAAVAGPVLKLLYPALPGMQAVGSAILPVLAVASFFFAFLAPYQAVMQGIGRADLPLKAVLCGAAVKLLANLTLVRLPAFQYHGGGSRHASMLSHNRLFCADFSEKNAPCGGFPYGCSDKTAFVRDFIGFFRVSCTESFDKQSLG